MKKDWKKDRAAGERHARMMRKKPELREALYGQAPAKDQPAGTRETAQRRDENG